MSQSVSSRLGDSPGRKWNRAGGSETITITQALTLASRPQIEQNPSRLGDSPGRKWNRADGSETITQTLTAASRPQIETIATVKLDQNYAAACSCICWIDGGSVITGYIDFADMFLERHLWLPRTGLVAAS